MSRNVKTLEVPVQCAPVLSNVCGGCALFILIVGSLLAVLLLDALRHPQGFAYATRATGAFERFWGLVVLLSWLCAMSALLLRRHVKQILPLTGGCVCLALIPFIAITPVGERVLLDLPPITIALVFAILDVGAIYAARRFVFTTRLAEVMA